MESLFAMLLVLLDIVAIVDAMKGALSAEKKILWIVLIIIVPVVGMFLYFLLGRMEQQST
ncbi:MAG: PLDc N-terminal domain-containing protein [Candidatus Omnitrophica bacterium]|nr:PLDc N-terminal domain-containing protein [Candidatus Omnitrophota bacterium]